MWIVAYVELELELEKGDTSSPHIHQCNQIKALSTYSIVDQVVYVCIRTEEALKSIAHLRIHIRPT